MKNRTAETELKSPIPPPRSFYNHFIRDIGNICSYPFHVAHISTVRIDRPKSPEDHFGAILAFGKSYIKSV